MKEASRGDRALRRMSGAVQGPNRLAVPACVFACAVAKAIVGIVGIVVCAHRRPHSDG